MSTWKMPVVRQWRVCSVVCVCCDHSLLFSCLCAIDVAQRRLCGDLARLQSRLMSLVRAGVVCGGEELIAAIVAVEGDVARACNSIVEGIT